MFFFKIIAQAKVLIIINQEKMYNNLDSIEHVVACLQEKYKGAKISVSPIFTNNLEELPIIMYNGTFDGQENFEENRFYFGVLTIGDVEYHMSADDSANLQIVLSDSYSEHDAMYNVFNVSPNSQIISAFHGLALRRLYYNDTNVPQLKYAGQFRGFEINIQR